MAEQTIHVGLYGGKGLFGGKEEPLEAHIINCGFSEQCSYHQKGTCMAVRSAFTPNCKFGRGQRVTGYTSRAKKYHEFKSTWQSHEAYGKLKHPGRKLGLINGLVVFAYPYIQIKVDGESVTLDDPGFISSTAYIPYEKFNPQLIHKIVKYRPRAIMGGIIDSYEKETVPLFLAHLKEILPDRFAEYEAEYGETKIDYVGRKALLNTIIPSLVAYESSRYPEFNEFWNWDGEYLTFVKGKKADFKIAKNYEVVELKIKPNPETTIIISDNDQVGENTVFVD